ncbi:unnamed protein product [Mytilus coruscus]|uniref:Endonuclease/exonuclease/phosphatase domain-containing protein n=1 Tax=Mytilus coruscus TaxID=42192 RepID=A0A6J8AE64_MYTCO|nr:unnamed protein product [Mytilus coruscus]
MEQYSRRTCLKSVAFLNQVLTNHSILRNSTVPHFCSDHCPTLIEINFFTTREKTYSKTVYDFDSGDYVSAMRHLQDIDWNSHFKNDINELNYILNSEVYHVMDKYIPKKVSTFDTEPDLSQVPPLAPCELSDIVVSEQDVIDHFQILNINKPAGPDNLPPKFLKAIFPSLVTPLSLLFNKSLQIGTVPSDWKLADVSANFKGKGEQDNVTNHRPISVTNCFSKILEKSRPR